MRTTLLYLIFLIIALSVSSCKNDFDLIAPHTDLPIVYCVLNQNDSAHYVRLQRTFAGEASALVMAANPDSVYYHSAQVQLEKWDDRQFSGKIDLSENMNIVKDSGIFATQPHTLYSTSEELFPESEYRLRVFIPEIDTELSASTFLVQNLKLIKPAPSQLSLSFANYDTNFEVEWLSAKHAKIYLLQVRLHYLEVHGNDTIPKQALWLISHFSSKNVTGGERMETLLQNRRFFQWLPSKIPTAESGIKRIIPRQALEILFTLGGDELYTWLEIHRNDQNPMTQKPVYTNIVNGLGIFSSRSEYVSGIKALSYATIDSIAGGQYTRQLGFVDSTDKFYSR